jgi:hypothetical protein
MARRLLVFVERLTIATSIAVLIALAPLPWWTPRWLIYVQIPLTVFLLVCYVGKLMLDTFFYPRYP